MELKDLRIGVLALVAIVPATVGVGATWGVYSFRLNDAETKIREQQQEVYRQGRVVDRVELQYTEIIRRLNRIEGAVNRTKDYEFPDR